MSETTQLTVQERPRSVIVDMAERFGMEAAPFEATIRATVCKGPITREEFAAFLLVAKEYNLNPLTKEIFAFPAKGGGIVPVVSIDGWCRIVNEHKAMNGLQFVYENDDAGKLVSVTCRIHRKDREQPIEVPEFMDECAGPGDVWKRWPRRMLRHKALIQAARYAFGFSGIFDEDEYDRMESARDVTPQPSGVMARLNGSQAGNGFDHEAVVAQVEDAAGPEKPKRRKNADKAAEITERLETAAEGQATPPAGEGTQAGQPEPQTDNAAQAASDALAGDDLPGGLKVGDKIVVENQDGARETLVVESTTGHAAPGEVYLLAGDAATADGRRMLYKDGVRFSTVSAEGVGKHPEYDQHSPELPEVEEEEGDEPTNPDVNDQAEEPEDEEEAFPEEFGAYIGQVEDAPTWVDVKKAMAAFYTTPLFKGMTPEQQNKIRGNTWDVIAEGKLPDRPDHASDVSAFRLWIEWEQDPDAISGTLAVLERQQGFQEKSPEFKDAIRKAVSIRLEGLKA